MLASNRPLSCGKLRRVFLDPKEILNRISLPYGAKVGDFGTGSGHYALSIIDRVGPNGTVYALDAFTPALSKVEKSARRRGAKIYTIESDFNRHIPLQDNLLHLAILGNILHQVRERERFILELLRILSPGGRALVIDWASSFRNMGPSEDMVVTPAEAVRLFRSAGFEAGNMLPAGSHHYAFIATSPL